ncbi:hypothetical protein N4G70_32210 [Streptomyces sp. ASQP_92]|uniref:hypothetical protein n=1 Tax=Streptomyces sp. ASQP_92 TaxID=2979116 RepID=UPI0021C01998|nr:hypothetical protein [Streptomyces sp. ASQP_92]MCT9093498.1 hypothetical protein [Streptomyces sp. ASQP_92]
MLKSELGTTPRTDETPDLIRIEADVPDDLSETAHTRLLATLTSTNVRFGHDLTADKKSVFWVELDQREP